MHELVAHAVLLFDPETGGITRARQVGYSLADVIDRVECAVAHGSGNVFEGMVPVVDPFPVDHH